MTAFLSCDVIDLFLTSGDADATSYRQKRPNSLRIRRQSAFATSLPSMERAPLPSRRTLYSGPGDFSASMPSAASMPEWESLVEEGRSAEMR